MSNITIPQFVQLTEKYHPLTVRGLLVCSVGIFFLSLSFFTSIQKLIGVSGIITLIAVFIPLVPYWLYFLYQRLLWTLVFSKTVNIVLAYNLQGLNEQKHKRRINSFFAELKNQISIRNLGGHIKLILAPEDITFRDHSTAEAKLLLGLKGSTILIWGSIVRQRGGFGIKTLFSYEFGYPSWVKKRDAQVVFSDKIQKILGSGLFSLDSKLIVEGNVFQDHIIPTVLFLLGFTSASLEKNDDAKYFLREFLNYYISERNLLRKKELGRTFVESRDLLVRILKNEIIKKMPAVDITTRDCAREILSLNPNDYDALIIESYCHESDGNRAEAIRINELAATHAPSRSSNHLFNRAYFSISDGDYINALKIYKSIPDENPTMTSSVSNYCNARYLETSNLAFLFADGYIQIRWDDKKHGRKILKKFLRLAKDRADLNEFVVVAQELLDIQ